MSNTLYDRDLQVWIATTIQHLKNHEFELLDIDNLIAELADLGKSERNALKSNVMILLAHLLKLRVQPRASENMQRSWYSSVLEHRQRVLSQLSDTPSFQGFLEEAIERAYPDSRKLAIKEGKLARFGVSVPSEDDYPVICPFSIEQILDENFFGI